MTEKHEEGNVEKEAVIAGARASSCAQVIEQAAERARPDIVAADQPQPVDPIGLGEVGRELCPVMHAAAALPNLRLRSTCLR